MTYAYHLISDDTTLGEYAIDNNMFHSQIEYLISIGAKFLSLDQANDLLTGKTKITKGVLLTFDDGYENTVTSVMAYLSKRRIPATMFICSGALSERSNIPEDYLLSNQLASVNAIRQWIDEKFDIGGHSIHHEMLTRLKMCDIEHEIGADRETLVRVFGCKMNAFAYPFGAVNSNVVRVCKKYYTMAFATNNGMIPMQTDRHLIYRYQVSRRVSSDQYRRVTEKKFSEMGWNECR